MIAEIRDLYDYNRWANQRVLDATAVLPHDEFVRDLRSSFPSVQATLAHILGAEWIWIQRWHGESPPRVPEHWDLSTHAKLRAQWTELERDQRSFIWALADADMDRVIRYRTFAGKSYEGPLAQLLRHVVNHSTYHRGQVITMLRQLGRAAVSTDLVLWHREQAERPRPVPLAPEPGAPQRAPSA